MVKSSIKRLSPELKSALDDLLARDRFTIDEIVAELNDRGAGLSRSTVGRYKQKFEKVADRMRDSRAMADALVAELGPAASEGKTGRLLVEILQGLVFDHLLSDSEEGDNKGASTMDMARLAKTLKDLASATKIDVDRERAITDLVARRAAAEAKSGAKAAGLTEETAQKIYEQVLGVRKKAA